MEDFENGNDSIPVTVTVATSSKKRPRQSLDADETVANGTERSSTDRKAEKRRKQEEKEAKRARKAATKSKKVNGIAEEQQPDHGEEVHMDAQLVEEAQEEAIAREEDGLDPDVEASPLAKKKASKGKKRAKQTDGDVADVAESQTPAATAYNTPSSSSNPFERSQKVSKSHSKGTSPASNTRGTEGETDEELRRKFRIPGAMDAWLAEGWRSYSYLTRLEAEGILVYKKGKFTEKEKTDIRAHLEVFKHINRLDSDELVNLIMSKGRAGGRKEFPKFWPEVAVHAPGRPIKAVKDFVKRDYDPRGNKGLWSKEEDKELLRAYEVHPNEWVKIADIVDRTETDCRDRYKNQLQHRDTRNTGHWDPEEERKLSQAVKEANTQVGNDPLGYEGPWDIVVQLMGGTRSRTQCRKKWQEQLRITELQKGDKTRLSKSDRPMLLDKLKRENVATEAEVDWASFCTGPWASIAPGSLRNSFWRLKIQIEDQETMPFPELLREISKKFPTESALPAKKPSRASKAPETPAPVSKDIIESEDEVDDFEEEEQDVGEVEAEFTEKSPRKSAVSDSE